jgi:hypothetical protein
MDYLSKTYLQRALTHYEDIKRDEVLFDSKDPVSIRVRKQAVCGALDVSKILDDSTKSAESKRERFFSKLNKKRKLEASYKADVIDLPDITPGF